MKSIVVSSQTKKDCYPNYVAFINTQKESKLYISQSRNSSISI